MVYKTRPGIVLVDVCGSSLLVATRAIWDGFSKIRPLSGWERFTWKMLENGSEWEIIRSVLAKLSKAKQEEMEPRLRALCDSLVKDGFLIEVPVEDETHDEG